MEQDPRAWIAALRSSHERLAALVQPLTPEQLRAQSYDDDWSVAQVLSHLGSGAEISLMSLPAALGQAEPLDRATAFQPVWDVWNAKSPDEQAADCLTWDEKQVQALEQLSGDELAGISMPFIGGTVLDAAGMVGLRLGEHALHTWDVAVTFDPEATVAPDAVDLLIDNVPGFLVPRLGRAPDVAFRAQIQTTGPDRDYLLIAADPVTITDWPGDGGGADTEISMPSEALLRLSYGRLDPAHTPAGVAAGPGYLDRLRTMFPGF
jgi:uncharacterized protein (TIGR03083 family)